MVDQILSNISRSISSMSQQNSQFRRMASENNRSISGFIRDVSKMFANQSKQQNSIDQSLNDIQSSSEQNVNATRQQSGLLQESISIQTQMLSELRNVSSAISGLVNAISGGKVGGLLGGLGKKAALGAAGLGLGALGISAAYNFLTNQSSLSQFNDMIGGAQTSEGTYTRGQAGSSALASTNMSAAEKAILETISKGESGGKYNIINYLAPGGGGKPQYFEMSENVQHPFKGKKGRTASGRYQFLWTTWASEVRAMGEDPNNFPFTPENQDRVALSHAIRRYRSLSGGRDLLKDIESENPKIHQNISRTLRPTWHGIQSGSYLGSAYKSFKKENTTTPAEQENIEDDQNPSEVDAQATSKPPITGGNVSYKYDEKKTIRNQPIQPELMAILKAAAKETGVDVEIYSGGQDPPGPGARRKGTTRHDYGNAADIILKRGKETVLDKKTIGQFIAASARGGATGIGHGPGYMKPGGIHVGFGEPAVWGANGEEENAPAWVKSAAAGVVDNENLQGSSSGYGQQSSGNSPGSGMGITDFLSSELSSIGLGALGSRIGGAISTLVSGASEMGSMLGGFASTTVADASRSLRIGKYKDLPIGTSDKPPAPLPGYPIPQTLGATNLGNIFEQISRSFRRTNLGTGNTIPKEGGQNISESMLGNSDLYSMVNEYALQREQNSVYVHRKDINVNEGRGEDPIRGIGNMAQGMQTLNGSDPGRGVSPSWYAQIFGGHLVPDSTLRESAFT